MGSIINGKSGNIFVKFDIYIKEIELFGWLNENYSNTFFYKDLTYLSNDAWNIIVKDINRIFIYNWKLINDLKL